MAKASRGGRRGAGGTAPAESDTLKAPVSLADADLDTLYAMDYKEFSDKAAYSHAYEGTGQEQIDFFSEHSNYDELISGMNDRQKEAFRRWTEGYFMDGSQYGGWDSMSTMDHHYTSRMDHVLDRAQLDEGIVVTRRATGELIMGAGHTRLTLKQAQSMEGETVFSRGAMSTGAAAEGLTIGASGKPVEYRIHIASGSTGAGMWIGDSRINGWGAEQREFVMNRDTYYRVGRSTYDSSRDVIQTDLFFIGRGAHDYGSGSK